MGILQMAPPAPGVPGIRPPPPPPTAAPMPVAPVVLPAVPVGGDQGPIGQAKVRKEVPDVPAPHRLSPSTSENTLPSLLGSHMQTPLVSPSGIASLAPMEKHLVPDVTDYAAEEQEQEECIFLD